MNLAIADTELVVRHLKILLQPFQERGLEDSAAPVKCIARQPHQFRLSEPQSANVLQLYLELLNIDDVADAHTRMTINERKLHTRLGKVLPDELQHQQLVEIRVEQRSNDRV